MDMLEQDLVIASEMGYAVVNGQEDAVPDKWACPICGENDTDYLTLVGDDSDEVVCESCGARYDIDIDAPVAEVDEDELWREDQRIQRALIEEAF